ncbi:MAG TPA: MmgE/PrpD family protein [Ktedonobacteraceae bacterium]|nr:MmgE/PrpD family protein [Ktedonobacteraceae bacterium]
MTSAEQLAAWVTQTSLADLTEEALQALKMRLLDALGCAIGALDGPPIQMLREQLADFGGRPLVTLIGGGKTAPDRAALYNSALVRYLDFNDSFLAPQETCHPSDNIGAILAASEYAHNDGKEFLTALAVAYQVQCRLSEIAPVRAQGFDHTTQGAYAVAAGVARALGLNEDQTANAIAISGTANNALRVTRTGSLSHWKGLAYPQTAFSATHATFLAMRGITGPREVFEGNKGFSEAIAGPFEMNWQQETLESVLKTSIKQYNAEFHSQSVLEGILELREQYQVRPEEIERIEIEIFGVAYHIIGGGEEGDKRHVRTKEEADHSLPYLVAVALLDGEVTPAQYAPERITCEDVQTLLQKVHIQPDDGLSARFPAEMPCRLRLFLSGNRFLHLEKHDYAGFFTRPFTWEQTEAKFTRLAEPSTEPALRQALIETVHHLETSTVHDLMNLLVQVKRRYPDE